MKHGGFIALTSVLIISATLLVIAVGAGAGAFYARMNALRREFKTESEAVADSCVGYVRLKLLADTAYAGEEVHSIAGGSCTISAKDSGTFSIAADYRSSVTVLSVALNDDAGIATEKEIPNAP
jgi:hypothetical protein